MEIEIFRWFLFLFLLFFYYWYFFLDVIEAFLAIHSDYPRQAPLILLNFKDGKNKVNQDVDLKV